MKRNLVVTFCVAVLLSSGVFLFDGLAASSQDFEVEHINANLLRVHVDGQWEELPLMPLADHLCQSKNRLFDRYCNDDLVAPE